ncbi:transposase [Streptomyces sp. NPDC056190]|uniref:transposase n=1 Tax=Streptomyces sp. NPDC056190 TaxID=3345741 RepID=UPI0035D9045B
MDSLRLVSRSALLLKAVLARCPDLDTTTGHVQAFAEMMNARTGHQLPDWLDKAQATDLPELVSFVNGVRSDQVAVTAGLSLPFSSGAVEGQVNRIKMLKRQMFGRAGFDLLRKRVLLAS